MRISMHKLLSAIGWKVVSAMVALMFIITGCAQPDNFDSEGEFAKHKEPMDKDQLAKSTTPGPYAMPVMSGETYAVSTYSGHGNAWDFNLSGSADYGEPVVAAADGVVSTVVSNYDHNDTSCGCFGNYVRINHDGDAYYSVYAHLNDVYVVSGQWVEKGQVLGTIGNTGYAAGYHLHFQIDNGSSSTTYNASYEYYSGGSKRSGTLSNGSSYQSYNNGKFEAAKDRNGGTSTVGTNTQVTATAPDDKGFSKTYTGGSYGECSVYYETQCNCGDGCPTTGVDGDGYDCINNTNSAWLVRTGFYTYYRDTIGGPRGSLGYPTGDEFAISGGAQQDFEKGYLTFSSSTGAVTAHY